MDVLHPHTLCNPQEMKELEAARARQGSQSQPRARGEAPTAPRELSPDGTESGEGLELPGRGEMGEKCWWIPNKDFSLLCCFPPLLLGHAESQRAGKDKDEAGDVSIHCRASQGAGDTRIWQGKT